MSPPRVFAALLALAPLLAAAGEGVQFAHGDWELACDNTRTCRAAGYSTQEDARSASVLITRRAGPYQPPRLQLKVAQGEDGPGVQGALRLRLAGKDHGALQPAGDDGYRFNEAQSRTALLALTRSGPLQVVDEAGTQWQVSDRGANAVLLKMDDVQGRVGTAAALIRKGDKGETSVLPALAVPTLHNAARGVQTTAADRALARSPVLLQAVRQAQLPLHESCWRYEDNALQQDELQVQRLDANTLLVSAPCWMAAYNSGDAWWTMPDAAPYRLQLVSTDANGYADGVLTAAHKGRGLGDCWSFQEWVWSGSDFASSRIAGTGDCRGEPGGFWDLPTLVTRVE